MLEDQPVETAISRRFRSGQQRRVPLSQCHDMPRVIEEIDQLAITPDAALLDGGVVTASLAPDALKELRIQLVVVVSYFQQPAAFWASIDYVGDGIARAASRFETDEFSVWQLLIL